MHYYRKNIGDYNKRAGRLSLLQNGVYERLRDAIYEREVFPTRAEAIEWTWASTLDEVSCVDFLLARFFDLQVDGRYEHPEIKEDLERYWEFCEKQASKSAGAVAAKKAKKNPPGTGKKPTGNPPGPNINPELTLETTNQEPLTNKQSTTSSASADRCPTAQIVELYREHARSLIQPRIVADAVKAQIAARWRQAPEFQNRTFWTQFFMQCEASDFLAGRALGRDGGKPFRAGLEWIVNAKNFAKIINGNYENQGASHAQSRQPDPGRRQSRTDRAAESIRRSHAAAGAAEDDEGAEGLF